MDIDAIRNEKGKLIGTVVLGLVTSFLMFFTIFNYYFGLKAKALETSEEVYVYAEESVPINSIGVLENYNKLNSKGCPNALASIFYKNTLVNATTLTNDELITIIYNYFSDNCGNPVTVTTDKMNEAIHALFGVADVSFIDTTNYKVNNEGTQITITPNSCANCNSNLTKEITKAGTSENNLFIYEDVYDGMNIVHYKWTFTKDASGTYYFVSIESI